jgi:hypothetical protein
VGTLAEMIPALTQQYDALVEPKETEHSAAQSETPRLDTRTSPLPEHFTSEEDYVPVFKENNRDLQILEARVLANITGFYTYMKAVRDTLRNFMDSRATTPLQAQRHALINVIYMTFLAYESARNAIDDLVEYEPTHAESAMIVLFTEMPACLFLLKTFAEDHPAGIDRTLANEVKKKRFEMRMEQYTTVVPALWDKVEAGASKNKKKWEKSESMVVGLRGAYDLYVLGRQANA